MSSLSSSHRLGPRAEDEDEDEEEEEDGGRVEERVRRGSVCPV